MAKLSLKPVSPELTALTGAPIDLKDHPNALRDAVVAHFSNQEGTWELQVQLCTNLETMPIEDASVERSQADSPYITVARLSAAPQPAWSDERATAVDDGMSFSPWHALAAHKPIGSIMRVRKATYEMAANFGATRNGNSVHEPSDLTTLAS